ncbi:tol-pal system protein YbgF [Hymenobacter sp. B81]|uniref:tol-pal system protein YbgF n=1 Tax=Hymenobacter sp. B81 TaxID=3344878 RepID=UPI0037DBF809
MSCFLRFFLLLACWVGAAPAALAQVPDTARPVRNIQLAPVEVAPEAIDTKGWLLMDKDIQLELEGAMHNLYNFKYDKAEKQFRSLKRRYPEHPMPYFLLGLSQWWKIVPSNVQTKQFDKPFFAYMDSAIVRGEALYARDPRNYEACFFLSAAYGFDARLHAERKDWRKATVGSKRALAYLEKSQEANGLSPEFLFGQALMNYYAPWISDNYPLLRPVLLFFPKGNKELGLRQLRSVADNGFYTGTEARMFLMKIYLNSEDKPAEALPLARQLAAQYPDNGYFQRFYALVSYNLGQFDECERVSRDILDKLGRGYPGYESSCGKYATYFLGSLMHRKYDDLNRAKEYYQRSIVFAEATGETSAGFYLYAHLNLARIADQQDDPAAAARYYAVVEDKWEDRKALEYREAKLYLRQHRRAS